MVAENFGKSKFSWKVGSPGRFRALNRLGVLAGANFIALRRHRCHCEFDMACRDTTSNIVPAKTIGAGHILHQAGRLPNRNLRCMEMMFLIALSQQGLLEQSPGAKINHSKKLLHVAVAEASGERLCFAKSAVEVLGVHPKFACTWRILTANGLKIAQGSSLARISLPAAPLLS